jgi:hypothetical protein
MEHVFRINRLNEPGPYHLADIFADISNYGVLPAIFADAVEIAWVISNTKVFLVDEPNEACNEMFVDDHDGSITIELSYLRCNSDEILYLDIIHELCHVKQHMNGRELYDESKPYVDRETEIEAYEVTIKEARRIGWNDKAIFDYLRVAWITPEEHKKLARRLELEIPAIQKDNLQ